jgi:tetratricopeptide (TPR) repeat protein
MAALLPVLAYRIGGLDVLVLLQASKALRYRLEYWRATAGLIADYPWFGCGPGNFQQYYTAYKLPEASESVADPHNFLLEIWATAGTPAALLFIAVLACVAWRAAHASRAEHTAVPPPAESDAPRGLTGWIYAGGAAGVLVGFAACMFLEGYLPSAALIPIGLPVAGLFVYAWHRWVRAGTVSPVVPAVAILVLLVHLLGAGGIGFSGVAQSLWVLLALLLGEAEGGASWCENPEATTRLRRQSALSWVSAGGGVLSRRGAAALAIASMCGLVIVARTSYFPILNAQTLLLEGELFAMRGQAVAALDAFRRAAQADPYSPAGWERVAGQAHERWVNTGDAEYGEAFRTALSASLAVNKRSSIAHSQAGDWWLTAYRKLGNRQHLDQAIEHDRVALRLYPNHSFWHAQLAWALHLAGNSQEAAREAEEALRLNELNPHREQKLAERLLFDEDRTHMDQLPPPGEQSAEQVMRELRIGIQRE